MKDQIRIRLEALKFGLEEIDFAHKETLNDPELEFGFEYEKPYPMNAVNSALYKKADIIKKRRREILYYRVFCFTQVAFSLRDYLKELYPEHEAKILSFYDEILDSGFKRKDFSNKPKHDPNKDMKFGLQMKLQKTEVKDGEKTKVYFYRFNWAFEGADSIDLCREFHKEIHDFIRNDLKIS